MMGQVMVIKYLYVSLTRIKYKEGFIWPAIYPSRSVPKPESEKMQALVSSWKRGDKMPFIFDTV